MSVSGDRVDYDSEKKPSNLAINIGFNYGWCRLSLKSSASQAEISATTMHDAFSDLLLATTRLLTGSQCQTVIWGGEGSGWFLDMSADFADGLGIAIHTMRDARWLRPAERWRPVRQDVMFESYSDMKQFAIDVTQEARKAKMYSVDTSGYMPHWGWSFPQKKFENLEELTTPLGYKPVATPSWK